MRWHLPLLLAVITLPQAHAQAALQSSLAEARSAYTELENRRAELQRRQQTQLTQAFQAQTTLLQISGWPQGLVLAGSLAESRPLPQSLLNATQRQGVAALKDLASQLETYTALQASTSERLAALTKLQATYASGNQRLSKLEKQALAAANTEAEGLAATLKAALANPTEAPPAMPEPTPALLPVPGRVVYGFHQPHATTTQTEGLTFAAPANSPVTAVSTGQVLYAGPFRNLGGLVIIKTGRLHYVYAGLATVAAQPGHTIRAGTAIGSLPNENPARLYLEVRQSGRPIDPARVLTQR